MKCEFEYCVYNRKSACILEETEIDGLGMCADCVMVSIDKTVMEEEKERQLKRMAVDGGVWYTNMK